MTTGVQSERVWNLFACDGSKPMIRIGEGDLYWLNAPSSGPSAPKTPAGSSTSTIG